MSLSSKQKLDKSKMVNFKQTDCFKINKIFWKYLATWPGDNPHPYYDWYSKIFIFIFVIVHDFLLTANFFFLPSQLDLFIQELLFYCTLMAIMVKCLTFIYFRDKIKLIFEVLDGDDFRPDTNYGLKIVQQYQNISKKLWKIFATFSLTAHIVHVVPPVITGKLTLPTCRYDFLSDAFREKLKYPLYIYQTLGIDFNMWYNVNMDNFFWGVMLLLIAQLDILDEKLRIVTEIETDDDVGPDVLRNKEEIIIKQLNKLIIHFDKVGKFCRLIQDSFGIAMFMQFGMASCTICVCLFRFTMPTDKEFYIFLFSYTFVMVTQILVPCTIGTKMMDKSYQLSSAIYDCNWSPRSLRFKSNFRLFVERTNKPLVMVGGKMFTLSLSAFTSIINSAYSFYTLLRHMRDS